MTEKTFREGLDLIFRKMLLWGLKEGLKAD
jgi:hypothetical protein